MNGTSVSAACFRSEKELPQSLAHFSGEKSLSAPVPRSSTVPHRKKRRRTNFFSKKKPPKKSNRVGGTTDQPMVIDTPAVVGLEPEPELLTIEPACQDIALNEPSSELLSLKISTHPPVSITPIAPEIRVPLLASCTNIPSIRPALTPNPDPSPEDLKGPSDTPAVAVSGFSRPALFSNPPIWAQVRIPP